MNKVKNKLQILKNAIMNELRLIKKNPKKETITFINWCKEVVKNNILFFAFVFTTLFNTVLLRYFTIHTLENVFYYKPFFADLAVILLVGSFSFLVKEKNQFKYLFVSSILLNLICIINSVYYTFYTSFSSISLLATSKYVVAVGDAVVENVLRLQDLVYIWAPIVLLVINHKLKLTKHLRKSNKKDKRKFLVSIVGAGISALIVILTLTSLEIGRFAKQWNREYIVMKFGIYTYHLNDLVKSIEPQITSLFGYDEALKTFTEYYKDTPEEQNWKNKYTGIFEGKNIISIHLESMQNFLIGLEFNGEEVTPNLNKLVKKSLYFSNFYAQVSVGTSSDSEFTLNTSLMPTNNGTAFVSYFDREYVSIAKLLKEKGYNTFSMHANNGSFWNRDVMHKKLGYDTFYSKNSYEIVEVIGLGLSDKSFFRQSVEKIKEINEKGKPYYGTLIMLTNHTPFSDTDKYGEFAVDLKEVVTLENGEKQTVSYPYMEGTKLGNYFKSAHYADEALGEFLVALEENGLMENTVIMLYGDHDARLPKSDYARLYNYDKTTDSTIAKEDPTYFDIDTYQYDMLRKVPFIIYSKETEKSLHKEVKTVMGMYDVMPTIGNMFGFYNKYQLGTDIFNTKGDNIVVFPNGNWVTNKVFYNSQKGAYLPLSNTEISDEYISDCNLYADNLLNVSNALIVFDLIRQDKEKQESDEDYVEERIID